MITTLAAGRIWQYSHSMGRMTVEHNLSKWGRTGGFCYPMDVAVAPNDIVFVISRGLGTMGQPGDRDNSTRIGKTTMAEDHIGDFARNGFTWPVGIAASPVDGKLYCTDEYECSIRVFDPEGVKPYPESDPEGEHLARWGVKGSAEGQLNGPSGLEFDQRGDLYVVDSLNSRVQKFNTNGEFIAAWGKPGSGTGEFNRPWGVTIDKKGAVYVADWGNHRVQKFSPDGEYLMSFGARPGMAAALQYPAGVAVDSDGDVYVTDWGNRRVQIYESNGDVLTAFYGDAMEFSRACQYQLARDSENIKRFRQNDDVTTFLSTFGRPIGIAIDDQDRIIVTDARGRLLVYRKDRAYETPPA